MRAAKCDAAGCVHGSLNCVSLVSLLVQSGSTALMIACHHNHVDLCRYLLSLHASINIQDSLGWTALMFSCREGHAELVDLLLEEEWDTDVDLTTSQGINALMCAADAGHTRIVRALMEKEADVNACTNVRTKQQQQQQQHGRQRGNGTHPCFCSLCAFTWSLCLCSVVRLVTLLCSKPATAATQPSCECCSQRARR